MKRFYKILYCFFCISLLLLGCKKETAESSFLNIGAEDQALLEQPFVHTADNRMVPLNTNLDVIKVSSSEDWCKVSVVDNSGRFLRLELYPNEGFEERTTEITVFGLNVQPITIPIKQWSNEPALVIAEAAGIEVIDGELDFTLHITSNIEFTFELPDWIEHVGDNAPYIGSKVYTFVASPIEPGDREGEIKVVTEEHPEFDDIVRIAQLQNVLYPTLGDFVPATGEKGSTVVLHGSSFGTNIELVEVFFNDEEAEVVTVEDNAITVIVPRAPGSSPTIKVKILGDELTYPTTFEYVPSWGLYTVTGDGNTNFRGGTLAEGRLRARYISIDKNGNIFASHRDEGNNRYIVRINEADDNVEALGASVGSGWQPNGTTVGTNNVVYLANDAKSGRSYFELDPANNWTPVERTITYADEAPPSSGGYLYRLLYNHRDGHLYGLMGHGDGTVLKINPATREGEVIYKLGAHPYWYGATINPTGGALYMAVNSAGIGYGPYQMDLNNVAGGFRRMNSLGPTSSATPNQLNDGSLQNAGFGQSWDMEFGKDGHLYISDFHNHVVRRVDLTAQTVETVIGQAGVSGNVDGKQGQARLNGPRGMAWNEDGTTLYIFDFSGSRLRKWMLD